MRKAVKVAGGQTALANLLDVSQPTVFGWLYRAGKISPNYALKCHIMLDGKVSAHDLRPDIYPRQTVTING